MRARLVFRTRQNLIITREIEIDPSTNNTDGIYDEEHMLFQLEMVGIQWLPGPPAGGKISDATALEEHMDSLIEYGLDHGLIGVKEIPPKPKPEE